MPRTPPPAAALPSTGPSPRRWLPLAVAAVVFAAMAARQQAFVHRYAVDVLYWDAWDLYRPLAHGQGWWDAFDQQHGPHRQGLGGLWVRFMAPRTGWDCRWDAVAVSAAVIAAVPLGVLLAWRCGVRGWALVAIPLVYLNTRQYQMWVALANPAHGAFPVLLLTGYCLAWFIRPAAGRLAAVVGLTLCSVFTGFGLFVGVLTPAVLAVELVDAARRDRRRVAPVAAALVATAVVWAAFAHGYRLDPASDRFRFPYRRPVEYLYFVGVLLANYAGVGIDTTGEPGWGTIALGLALAVAAATVCGVRLARVLRVGVARDPASVAIACLAAFGLLFALDAAVGRTPDGWRAAAESRYVTLSIPTGLAILLHLATSRGRAGRVAAVAFAGLLAAGTALPQPGDVGSARRVRDGCLRFRAAYLLTGDQRSAERLARFPIYPRPLDDGLLRYMWPRRLNLFAPDAVGPAAPAATPRRTGGR